MFSRFDLIPSLEFPASLLDLCNGKAILNFNDLYSPNDLITGPNNPTLKIYNGFPTAVYVEFVS